MAYQEPWYRSNLVLIRFLPLLLLGVAVAQTSLSGPAQTVMQAVFGLAMLAFIAQVGWNVRADREAAKSDPKK